DPSEPRSPERVAEPPAARSNAGKQDTPSQSVDGHDGNGVASPSGSAGPASDGGLALSGLRQHSRGDASSSAPEPKVSWEAGQVQHRTGGTVHESAAPRRTDREPRSLAEAGFQPRKDGRLVYRDPRGKFKAILH